jgi:GTP-binding protein HflX
VHAFKSTLDEAVYADALMIVIDVSDPHHAEQLEVTEQILSELGAGDTPRIYVLNKCDRGAAALPAIGTPASREHTVLLSAVTGQGIELLENELRELLLAGKRRVVFHIPASEGRALNVLYTSATVEDVEYTAEGMRVTAVVDARVYGMLRAFDPNYVPPTED